MTIYKYFFLILGEEKCANFECLKTAIDCAYKDFSNRYIYPLRITEEDGSIILNGEFFKKNIKRLHMKKNYLDIIEKNLKKEKKRLNKRKLFKWKIRKA